MKEYNFSVPKTAELNFLARGGNTELNFKSNSVVFHFDFNSVLFQYRPFYLFLIGSISYFE